MILGNASLLQTHTHTIFISPSCLHLRGWNRRKDQGPGLELRKTVQREVEDIIANAIHIPTFLRACPAVGTGHFLLCDVREPGLLCPHSLRPGGLDVEPDRVGGARRGWLAWLSQGSWSRDKPPASLQPIYKGKWISGSLSIRLSYELSDLWDVYMNQKMCYLMKIASFNILAWQAKNCTSLGESARVNDFFFPLSPWICLSSLYPAKNRKTVLGSSGQSAIGLWAQGGLGISTFIALPKGSHTQPLPWDVSGPTGGC